MNSRITEFNGAILAGIKVQMSLVNDQTTRLWRQFIPIKKDLTGLSGTELYSVEKYPEDYFLNFSPVKEFEKWAAVPVSDAFQAEDPIHILEIPEGLYAVFLYKGKSSEAHKVYQYIFEEWMPNSAYQVDHRPHFAVMGDKYRNDHPDSEEEFWVPIQKSN